MFKFLNNIGPGPLIAAAFIGPGTVTMCTLAGVKFGYALLWVVGLSVFATIVLQEMSARLGVISQKGLAQVIRTEIQHPVFKILAILLLISSILIGNAAYEAGNISGAGLGVETLFGSMQFTLFHHNFYFSALIVGTMAFIALYLGNYKVIERFLIGLVVLMSIAFLSTAIITKPDWSQIMTGLFKPAPRRDNLLIILGLVGTTIVPYNLFLHASLAKTKWKKKRQLKYAQRDTVIAIVLGGLISMSIIIAAAAIPINDISSATDLALGLEPLFGQYAKFLLALGLFAAGITSAITAPLAAAYVTCGCLGWSTELKSKPFRTIWMLVLGIGVLFSVLYFKPITVIKFAQIANGLLLPVIVLLLFWIMNNSKILGTYVNSKIQNIALFFIIVLAISLGLKGIFSAL
jgi:NRAMP (natural resistance-associated macrophage protein)-like metal ion transporter